MAFENPWKNISWYNTIAECDKTIVSECLAGSGKAKPETQIHCELLPEPFIGDFNANVYLLSGNPGLSQMDFLYVFNKELEAQLQETLLQNPESHNPVHFMWLDNRGSNRVCATRHPGYEWWQRILSSILPVNDNPRICDIEFYPYHSRNIPKFSEQLPSNAYVDYYIREAIKKNKWIIILRCKKEWQDRIKELKTHKKLLYCSSAQNVCVTENNLVGLDGQKISKDTWNALLEAMR